jgi:hypothetical protein
MGASAEDIALFSGAPAKGGASAEDIALFSGAEAKTDVGPEARHERTAIHQPAVKSDEELGLDEGPKFFRGTPALLFADTKSPSGRFVANAKDAPGTEAYASHHSGDEMNDPGAQMLTGAALAAPLAAAAPAGLAPMLSGAQQSAMMGQNPAVGAALGAIPGIPGAARAADNAIGEAALSSVRPVGSPPSLPARIIGKGLGMAAGGATHGPLGMLVGHDLGGRAAGAFSRAADATTNALAERYLMQQADAGLAGRGLVQIGAQPGPQVSGASPVPMVNLAPLVHQPLPPPATVPNGAFGPFLDEISGQPVTQAGQGGFLPTDAPTAAGKALPPSLRDDVVRSAKAFRDQPYDVDAPAGPSVEDQLARSVRMLGQLKSAKSAGKLTPADIQDAVKAGMSPLAVAKVVGQEAFDAAMGK